MVSARLDAMVTNPGQRRYLERIDGVWADALVTGMTFLEDLGYQLQPPLFHQKGDSIAYGAGGTGITFDFEPDSGIIGGSALFAATARPDTLHALLTLADPAFRARQWRSNGLPFHPDEIRDEVARWSRLLPRVVPREGEALLRRDS